jgi:hypothetical protein
MTPPAVHQGRPDTYASGRPTRLSDFRYDMRAGDLPVERPTIAELQLHRARAVRRGDFRFARVYELVVEHRLAEAGAA